ncbi:bacterial group 2 Ig-like protein [Paenibacillus sp. oral taxon 786 str. D14]|uniref:Ig-like domain-containing protein n=1 Tax=Paenibacillus sp. oral taxon 786 TaxID=652715 RepID=UPI0001AFDC62|nr:Ig-like domain-containing protein [Paenibacillus sp. oral taxon 786]EES72536.1 bacterial group 2 Ig-like protein [Paenibacillus sp. oral taxon 786 str. D14]
MIANRKMTYWMLVLTLLLSVLAPTGAFAATGDIKEINIDGAGTTVELGVGKTKQLKATASLEGGGTKDVTTTVTWSSSDPAVAKVTEGGGLVTALKSGTATITAEYKNTTTEVGSVSTITIKVTDTYTELVLEYKLDGKYNLDTSDTDLTVIAKAKVENAAVEPKIVTEEADWTSSNANVLTVEKGQITLTGTGEATITAKYAGLTASFKAKVTSPYSGLKLFKTVGTTETEIKEKEDLELIMADKEVKLQVKTVLKSNPSTTNDVTDKATWSSSDTNVATVEDGTVKIVSTGKATITATYYGEQAKVDIYVRAPYEAILLTPSGDQTLFIGETLAVNAGVRVKANETQDVSSAAEWTSSNKLVATVSDNGVVTAKAAGSTTIKASYQGVSKSFKLTVLPTVTELKVEKEKLEVYVGGSASLPKVTGTKLDGESIDLSDAITWTSSQEGIAVVEDGKIVTKDLDDSVVSAEVTLTGKLMEAGTGLTPNADFPIRGTTVEVKVTVKEKVLTLISTKTSMDIVIGEENALPEITVVYENGVEQTNPAGVEWSVTGSNAVLKSTAEGKKLKGLSKGSATLKGTFENKTISVSVSIEPKITKIVVEPQTIDLNIKKSKSIKVTGYYADGKKVTLSSKMGWVSSDVNVATVSSSSVKAVAEGTATITGSYQGNVVTVKVNVVPKLVKLEVSEKKLQLAPGAAKSLVLTATYDNGKVVTVTGSAKWTTSKANVAKVSAGQIEAIAKGTASIKAEYGGKKVSISVSVK